MITCWRVLSALSASIGWCFRFHNVHVPYGDSLNDEAIDSNMDINCVEMILKHVLDEHEGVKEAVNALYEELTERANAEGQKKARETCEAVMNGDSMPLHRSCLRSLSRTSIVFSLGSVNPTGLDLCESFTRG